MLAVGAPDAAGSRVVKIFVQDNNGAFVERANITAPATALSSSRFGQQARSAILHARVSASVALQCELGFLH